MPPSSDQLCWKVNWIGGELKAQFYGRVEPTKIYRCPIKAAKRLLAGAAYVCVHVSVIDEALRLIDG